LQQQNTPDGRENQKRNASEIGQGEGGAKPSEMDSKITSILNLSYIYLKVRVGINTLNIRQCLP